MKLNLPLLGAMAVMVTFVFMMWMIEPQADHHFDRDFNSRPYQGWYSDMEYHERRQTELMEQHEFRQQRMEQADVDAINRARLKAYHESLRTGKW